MFIKPEPASPAPPRLADGPSDLELLAGWRAGDRACGGALYERYAVHVRAFLARRLYDKSVVDDLVQATFAALPTSTAHVAEFVAYLNGIAFFKFTRHIRTQRKGARPCDPDELGLVPDEQADPEHIITAASERSGLLDALAGLPDKYRQVLEMTFWEGKTAAEIGEATGVPAGTAVSRLRLAKEQLALSLAADAEQRKRWVFTPPKQPVKPPAPSFPVRESAPAPAPARSLPKRPDSSGSRDEMRARVVEAAKSGMTKPAAAEALGISTSWLTVLWSEVPGAPRFADGRKIETPARAAKAAAAAQRKEERRAAKKAAKAAAERPVVPALPPRAKHPLGRPPRREPAPTADASVDDGWVVIDAGRCLVARVTPGLTAEQALGRCIGVARAKAIGERAADFYRRFHAEREGDTAIVSRETIARMLAETRRS